MYKHKPIPKTDVSIGVGKDKIVYKCKNGIVELPDIYPQFNPIEKKKEKKIERKNKKDS